MNLTKDNYFLFPGGEVHVTWNPSNSIITMHDYSMNGLMALAQVVEIIRRKWRDGSKIHIHYPYLPYARQDRAMKENESFSLKVFCEFLNILDFDKITLYDPHSDVGPALIKNCETLSQDSIARCALPVEWLMDGVLYVSPDAGAYKKLSKLIPNDECIAVGVKQRDAQGGISGTRVFSPRPIQGARCLIVDDICDGGRTFTELAKALREQGAAVIALYVTHGIFSNGFAELRKCIDHIYTTNTIPQNNDTPEDFVSVYTLI